MEGGAGSVTILTDLELKFPLVPACGSRFLRFVFFLELSSQRF